MGDVALCIFLQWRISGFVEPQLCAYDIFVTIASFLPRKGAKSSILHEDTAIGSKSHFKSVESFFVLS